MISGVALIDKPLDLTSFGVVARIKRVYKPEGVIRVGHTGTLDPLATGLLPICLGEATKFAQRMLDADKGYLATVKLGEATESGDREGEVIARGRADFSLGEINLALQKFLGTIQQTPPKFSALKIDGRPAYALAREGKVVELAARSVTIHKLSLVAHRPETRELDLEVTCSKGTYIRSLAIDIGEALGTFAHLAALRRTTTGGFDLSQTRTLDDWMSASPDERRAWLLPADSLIQDLPRIDLDAQQSIDLRNGKLVAVNASAEVAPQFRIYDESSALVGLAEIILVSGEPHLKSQRLMSTAQQA